MMNVETLVNPKTKFQRNLVKKHCPKFPVEVVVTLAIQLDSLLPPKDLVVFFFVITCFAVRPPSVIVVVAFIPLWQIPVRESCKRGVSFFVKKKLQGLVWVLVGWPGRLQASIYRNKGVAEVPLSKHCWKEEMKRHMQEPFLSSKLLF